MKIRLEGTEKEIYNIIGFLQSAKLATGYQGDYEILKVKSVSKFYPNSQAKTGRVYLEVE